MLAARRIKLLVVAVFVLSVFLVGSSFAAEGIAYVDLGMVFDGYDKTKDYDVDLEKTQEAKQKEINDKVKEIKDLQDKLPLLSEKEKVTKQAEIDKKTKSLQEFQREAETSLRQKRDDSLKEILQEIQDTVEGIAKKNKYDFVLNDNVLLYGDSKMDISKEVLKVLNSGYTKKK